MKKTPVEQSEFQTIEINGKQAIVLVPELVNDLAVVDLNVLKRLATFLPKASIHQIKSDFKARLDECNGLGEYVDALRDELSFHETCNLITTVKIEKNVVVEEPVRVYPMERE